MEINALCRTTLWFLSICIASGWGQEYTISTIAGGVPPPTPMPGLNASIGPPQGVAADAAGNLYFTSLNCAFKLDPNGVLSLVAGNSRPGYSGDGGPATSAQLSSPIGVAVDPAGNLFIADTGTRRIRRVSPNGIITTVAGTGIAGFSGDGGPATSAQLMFPIAVAVDSTGNLYIADTASSRIRRVSTNGIISTVAGNGISGFSGDGGPATSAQLNYPRGVAVDSKGNLYIAEMLNKRIRRVSPVGIITTVAGDGTYGSSGDGGPAASAQLSNPYGICVDSTGSLFIAEYSDARVRRVSPDGIITTVAGNGTWGYSGDGGPATSAQLATPFGVAMDLAGNLYVVAQDSLRIRRVSASGTITTVAGNGTWAYSGDGGPATSAQLANPSGVAADSLGNLYITDGVNFRVRRISPTGIMTTAAGNGMQGYAGDGGPATSAQLSPASVAVDSNNYLYIADGSNRVLRVSPDGIITTVAGNGISGFSGDGGPATSAQLSSPSGVVLDLIGNLYITDGYTRVRRVSANGIITTVAGNGTGGYSGDGGPATSAQLSPHTVAVDSIGNLYITDGASRVRRVSPNGIITTVAGNGTSGYSGDGGPATSAQLLSTAGVALDSLDNVYIADGGTRVRRVSPAGIITTVAGNGTSGYSGDGGPATSAQLADLSGITVDRTGRVYLSQEGAVRLLTPTDTPCAYTVAPPTLTYPASGGNLNVSIQTSAGCSWTITGMPIWIVTPALLGSGPVSITLSVPANTGAARAANITIAGVLISIVQAAGTPICIFAINPAGQAFGAAGGSGAIIVSATAGCTWNAASPLSWVTITSGASGAGDGQVVYQVAANPGPYRSGLITATGQSFSIEQSGAATATFQTAGAMAQIASGGGWKTTFTLVNNGISAAQARLIFFSDSGTELTLPLTFPQGGAGPILTSAIERTLNAGAALIIECEDPLRQDAQQGWAMLLSDGSVSGFAIFRQRIGDDEQEAVVPLESRTANGYVLAFDNTSGVQTGVAVANLSAVPGVLTVVIRDDAGGEMLAATLDLVARGHTAFVLPALYPVASQRRGTIEFRPPIGGQISVLGLRFSPKGSVTTIPALAK